MTGRGPIFWGQPEYTVGRSAEHDLSVRACTGLAGRARQNYATTPKLYDHSKIMRPLGIHWTTAATEPDPPKLYDHWVYTGLLRPAVAIRAGPANKIYDHSWPDPPKLSDHWVYTLNCCGHRAGPTPKLCDHWVYTGLLRPQSQAAAKNYTTTGYTLDYCGPCSSCRRYSCALGGATVSTTRAGAMRP